MQIRSKNIVKRARLRFDGRLAKVLIERPDLSYGQIGRAFGISETVIRRVTKEFRIGPRRRGPKPSKQGIRQ